MTFCPVAASVHAHGNFLDRFADFGEAVAEKLAEWKLDSERVGYFLIEQDGDSAELVIALLRGDRYGFDRAFERHYEAAAEAAVRADEKAARDNV